jgi:acid phosphatase
MASMLARALAATLVAFAASAAEPPHPGPIVLVIMENHAYAQIIDSVKAPYISGLAHAGANFTQSFAVAHPSEPNYFALFSGSTWDVRDDGAHDIDAPSLAGALRRAGRDFAGYIERGSPRKHNPWESFADARGVERDFAAFPRDFAALPAVSFVIPNLAHDMHDGTVEAGDRWLKQALGAYAEWSLAHDVLFILTFDEDDDKSGNRIPTLFYGGPVAPGTYAERIDHYAVLRTIEAMEGLPPLAESAKRAPIADAWRPSR